MPSQHSKPQESGNILIYILGAIFLLGILVVMVKGSSTPGSNIDRESMMIRVSEVQSYGQELERAIVYVMRNGHSESDIRFAHPDADPAYGNIADTPTRQIFAVEGGAAKYRAPLSGIQVTPTDWLFSGQNIVTGVASSDSCTTPSCTDLIALLMNVNKEFCILINEKNDIENIAGNPPQDLGFIAYSDVFVGTFINTRHIKDDATLYLSGHLEGCFEGDTDPLAGTYHYYRVLLAR